MKFHEKDDILYMLIEMFYIASWNIMYMFYERIFPMASTARKFLGT